MIDTTENLLMLDTETTNDIDCPLVYDVGYQIFSIDGGLKCERSFLNTDIFNDAELMESAYFKDKIPQYLEDVKNGKRIVKPFAYIKKIIANDCKRYNVKFACAHNAAFDNRALNTTQRYQTTSKYRYFLPFGTTWLCTLKMCRQILKNNDSFGEFCYNNNYLTKKGGRRYTAEIIYRWLTDNTNFVESHTGLEDVKIERKIFEFCIFENPEVDGKLW